MSIFVVPENPGTSIQITGEETSRPPASVSETVAIVGSHDWGPSREPTLVSSFAEFEAVFGNSDTDLRDAVLGAFSGPAVEGHAGAGAVIVYRAGIASGGSNLAKASVVINNTTPVAGITLTALQNGARGNRLSYVTEDDPADPTNRDRLRIRLDGQTVETFAYPRTDLAALRDAINNRPSKYVVATLGTDGVALTASAGTSLTGGRDGTALTATEYADALDALEYAPFGILCFANLSDSAIQATVTSWIQAQEAAMRPVRAVFGGPSSETLDQATTRTGGIRDPHVISLGAGAIRDGVLDKDIGLAKFAPRVAGGLAGVGSGRALTFLPFAGVTLLDPIQVTSDRLREAADEGVTVLARASSPRADVVINRGVTTFIDADAAGRPLEVFSEPRLVGIIDGFIRQMKIWGDENIVGLPNSENTRAAVRDYGSGLLSALFTDGLILNDPEEPYFVRTPEPDPANPDLIPFEFGFKFVQTTNYLVGVGKVRV